ncbi:M48 family metallopeptidase [Noviherbaspirillum sp.]|uniref:M48 family metallopeptidase n=1 Tax=Noviherbaspirillum sp. TaxID=1926288 RepID=UPI002D6356EA|nr:M48 family metallopeptidase [Noviherbaspirillum sp.]HZW22252.1 M48 family metallopeptidase [Noviherbaspirillum sp.]
MSVPAYYFDGKSSRRHAVRLAVNGQLAVLTGDADRECPLAELRVSERLSHGQRKVSFPDGAYLEILDATAFDAMLLDTRHRDSLVVRLQQSWRGTLAALCATAAILIVGYVYVLPAAANLAAKALPVSAERSIGREALAFLDKRMLSASSLPPERQQAIRERFMSLVPPLDGAPHHELVFRKSRVGPNAFALPSGQIVLTDEIVHLAGGDEAVVAILAHELGHLHERHLTRRVIQGSIIGIFATTLFGDVSALLANIPTAMLDLKYSRDAEREADDYAIAMLKKNGISPAALARVFEALEKAEKEKGGSPPYLSSHPSAAERIARIREAM